MKTSIDREAKEDLQMNERAEKAVKTRQLHKEKQRQKELMNKRIKEAMINSLLETLEAESISPADKLEASKILNELRKEH